MKMEDFILKKKFLKDNYIYMIIFLCMSIAFIIPYLRTGRLVTGADWLFHAARVEEIYRNLRHGELFTFIATSTFHHSGVGSFMFYPTFYFYPWVFLRFFLSPIESFYVWYCLVTFVAFLIAYFSMKTYSKNPLISFIFSLLYVCNTYRIFLGTNSTLGEFVGISFLPLVFLSFYFIFFKENKNWSSTILLGISMALLIYAHLLSAIITCEIFVGILLLALLFWKPINIFRKIKYAICSAIITVTLILPMLYLFKSDFIGKNITSAYFGISMSLLNSLPNIFTGSLSNGAIGGISGWSIGVVLISVVLVGWYYCRNKTELMYIYLLGVVILFISTSTFPWYLFKNSILGIIQLTYRYLSYSCLFLSIVGSYMFYSLINKLFANVSFNFIRKLAISFLICIGSIMLFFAAVTPNLNLARSGSSIFTQSSKQKIFPNVTVLNNYNYKKQFDYIVPFGETDYYPKKSLYNKNGIIKQETYINGQKSKTNIIKTEPNKVIYNFYLKHKSEINLPILAYAHTKVYLNDKPIHYKNSNRGTVFITKKNSKLGTNRIEVIYKPNIMFYICVLISALSWLVVILLLVCKS